MPLRTIRPALGLTLTIIALAALPAAASGSILPALLLNQNAGTAAASMTPIGFDLDFNPTTGDSPRNLTISLPAGLLANMNIDNGACLSSTVLVPACAIGRGTATALGLPLTFGLYLIQPPAAADVAGIAFGVGGSALASGGVTLRRSASVGLDLSLSDLTSLQISQMQFTLNDLRLPTSCPTTPANVNVKANSRRVARLASASAPLTVTSCSRLAYTPAVTGSITRDPADAGASAVVEITQPAGQSSSSQLELALPPTLSPNVPAERGCLIHASCVIGSATASSPLLPASAILDGTIVLGGTPQAPLIKVSFPPPLSFALTGPLDPATGTMTLSAPDLPLTGLTLDITGPAPARAFLLQRCGRTQIGGTFTPDDGNAAARVLGAVHVTCPGRPTASRSLTGLASGDPELSLGVSRGADAPNIESLAIALSGGLRLDRGAFAHDRTCTHRRCRLSLDGLSLTGATAAAASYQAGRLLLTLARPVATFSLKLARPLLSEASGLQLALAQRREVSVGVAMTVTDAAGTQTAIALKPLSVS